MTALPLPDGAWWVQLGVRSGVKHDRGLEPLTAPRVAAHWPITSASLQVALKQGELAAAGLLEGDEQLTPEQVAEATKIMRRRL